MAGGGAPKRPDDEDGYASKPANAVGEAPSPHARDRAAPRGFDKHDCRVVPPRDLADHGRGVGCGDELYPHLDSRVSARLCGSSEPRVAPGRESVGPEVGERAEIAWYARVGERNHSDGDESASGLACHRGRLLLDRGIVPRVALKRHQHGPAGRRPAPAAVVACHASTVRLPG
jgi:hypothetical protein